jgi:hypothetical protein
MTRFGHLVGAGLLAVCTGELVNISMGIIISRRDVLWVLFYYCSSLCYDCYSYQSLLLLFCGAMVTVRSEREHSARRGWSN